MNNDLKYRALPGNLCMAESVPFCQRHYYRAEVPIKDMMHPLFMNSVRDNLRTSDLITLVCASNPGRVDERCLEMQDVVVVSMSAEAIDLQPCGPLLKFEDPSKKTEVDPSKKTEKSSASKKSNKKKAA